MGNFYDSWLLKITVLGVLVTVLSGLILMASAFTVVQDQTLTNKQDIHDIKKQAAEIYGIHTDIAVIKLQLIEMNKKLDGSKAQER